MYEIPSEPTKTVEETKPTKPATPEVEVEPIKPTTPEVEVKPTKPVTPEGVVNPSKPVTLSSKEEEKPDTSSKKKKMTCTSTYKKKYGDKVFNIKVKNASGKVKYTSSNNKVATVNSKGKVTIKGCGYTKITVKADNGKVTSKTIKGLKSKKKYYVKVRAYKKISGKKYYGSFSSIKAVKVK